MGAAIRLAIDGVTHAMGMQFTLRESRALYGLLAETTSDIILKTNCEGFVVQASPALEQLGFPVPNMLIGPHLLDLVAHTHAGIVGDSLAAAIEGGRVGRWVEFPAASADGTEHWFELQLRALTDAKGKVYGALGVMRCVDERRAMSDRLFAATYTDALTGLTNRQAFISMLEHMLDDGPDGCLALFSVDFFRAINMKYGQATGDGVLVVFADLLRELLRGEDMISRIGSERFAVLLPRTDPEQAEAICNRVVRTLGDLRQTVGESRMAITASASVARVAGTLDETLERAEMALFVAKAKGRNRLEREKV